MFLNRTFQVIVSYQPLQFSNTADADAKVKQGRAHLCLLRVDSLVGRQKGAHDKGVLGEPGSGDLLWPKTGRESCSLKFAC